MMLEHKQAVVRADAFYFRLQRSGDFVSGGVGDDRDPLNGLEAQTNVDGVARSGNQLRINRMEISAIWHTKRTLELRGNHVPAISDLTQLLPWPRFRPS